MGVSIDTRKAHLVRQHGDLIAIYSWINDERALILLPAYRKGAPWYCVLESAAWKYDNPRYLARQCAQACDVLGIEPNTSNWSRVATIIHEGLPDLITMPSAPAPEYHNGDFGHVELRADGELLAGQQIQVQREGVSFGAANA